MRASSAAEAAAVAHTAARATPPTPPPPPHTHTRPRPPWTPPPTPAPLLLAERAPWYDPRARLGFGPAGRVQGVSPHPAAASFELPDATPLALWHIARAPKSEAWLVMTTARARDSRSPLGEGGQADYLTWIRGADTRSKTLVPEPPALT